jgi:hypothetical protein
MSADPVTPALPSADEWNRLVLAVNGLQSDIGRMRKDYRELETRVSLVERDAGGAK